MRQYALAFAPVAFELVDTGYNLDPSYGDSEVEQRPINIRMLYLAILQRSLLDLFTYPPETRIYERSYDFFFVPPMYLARSEGRKGSSSYDVAYISFSDICDTLGFHIDAFRVSLKSKMEAKDNSGLHRLRPE